MAMYPNGRFMSRSPGRHFGVAPGLDVYYRGLGDRFNLFASDVMSKVASSPNGYGMTALTQPINPGGLGTSNTVTGSGTATGTMQSGRNADAALTGSGDVTNAPLGLIVSIVAALIGSGNVTSAAANALASMVASITGSGNVTATARGLASLGAALVGSGAVNANNTQLMSIAASIRGYGDLTPEGIRDSVWNAILANYPTAGTAGKTLELAGSGGVDYQALGEAVWAILLADANNPGSMGEFVQNISGGGGGSGLTLAQFLALK